MKKFGIQVFILIIVTFTALYFGILGPGGGNIPFLQPKPAPLPSKQIQVLINDITIKVELADTDAKRSLGLGNRQSLATDSGMLFVFPKPDKHVFWMKGMHFSLDLIWITGNQIVAIDKMVPPPTVGQQDQDLPRFGHEEAVDKVLEVNGGFSDSNDIKVGDLVQIQ